MRRATWYWPGRRRRGQAFALAAGQVCRDEFAVHFDGGGELLTVDGSPAAMRRSLANVSARGSDFSETPQVPLARASCRLATLSPRVKSRTR